MQCPTRGFVPDEGAGEGDLGAGMAKPCGRPSQKLEPGRAAAKMRDLASLNSRAAAGAGEGIRTLDPNLGKVVLYP